MSEPVRFKDSLKGLWILLRPNGRRILVRCIFGAVRIAASLAFVWVCKSLIDIVTGNLDRPLYAYVALMAGIMLVQYFNNLCASYYEGLITVKANAEMRADAFGYVMRSRWDGLETFHSGDTVNRLEEDIRVAVELVCSRIPEILITLLQLVAASVYLIMLSPELWWLLTGLMIIAVVGSKMFFRTTRKLTLDIRKEESGIQGYLQENILHRAVALTLGRLSDILKALAGKQDVVVEKTTARLRLGTTARGFMSLGFSAGYAAAFLWGIFGIRSGTVTFGMMMAFVQLVGQVQAPISNLGRHIPAFIHALTSVDRIVELASLPQEKYGKSEMIDGVAGITLKNVSFRYRGQSGPVLDNFSHTFAPGSLTAVTGETGAGKSTLMRLLLALLHPDSGTVCLTSDGREIPVSADTRCNFMYVPQGNSLMSGTVRQNFRMAKPDATDEEMRSALKVASADFVMDLPDGLDSICGEEGSGFSEGQSQRIAIARALLHPGSIMILDESTSALDPATEQALLHNLHEFCCSRKTVLFVSHRESVSQWADATLNL